MTTTTISNERRTQPQVHDHPRPRTVRRRHPCPQQSAGRCRRRSQCARAATSSSQPALSQSPAHLQRRHAGGPEGCSARSHIRLDGNIIIGAGAEGYARRAQNKQQPAALHTQRRDATQEPPSLPASTVTTSRMEWISFSATASLILVDRVADSVIMLLYLHCRTNTRTRT